jgi:integrase
MGLYRRGKTYWFTITYEGKRIQKSTDTDDKKLAKKIYSKTMFDLIEGSYFEAAKLKKITFNDMATKYVQRYEKSRDKASLKRLLPVFGEMVIADITTEAVSDYRHERLKVARPATVYQELALMRRMFNVARREWKWGKDNPVSALSFSVGNSNARDRWLTSKEEQFLLSAATNPFWLRSMLLVALHTGMRQGEILGLKWQNVDLKRRMVRVVKSKNGEKRGIPMSDTLFGVLKGISVRDISGRVFPISYSSVRHAYDKLVAKTCFEDFHFHDLRHTFATRLVQNGVDLYKVKELLGHKSISMTMRYAHHCPDSLRASVDILDSCYKSATVEYNKSRVVEKILLNQ